MTQTSDWEKTNLKESAVNTLNTFPIRLKKPLLMYFLKIHGFLGRLFPLVRKFSTRRLIDLQAGLIKAFEDVLAQPKEQHSTIFKNLVIQTHSSASCLYLRPYSCTQITKSEIQTMTSIRVKKTRINPQFSL